MPSLLRTKLQLPPIHSKHVSRKRLLIDKGMRLDAHIVLVSAPAGFGKSSCLIEWAHHLQDEGVAVAWYALDEQDNDPVRFSAYLLEAFRYLGNSFEALPQIDSKIDIYEIINQILNAVNEYGNPLVLVLDDYHLISSEQIHDVISRVGEYLPPNMRLAIGTRADPPLQLARLRALGKVSEIRMSDLRFTMNEMTSWLNSVLGWKPSKTVLNQVEALTEGWAVAITLILTSQTYPDEQMLINQLARYSKSQRHIFDYFAYEVLENQSEDIRHFLLNTCVLNRLEPDVCNVLTQKQNALLMLNELTINSFFIIPLSNSAPIYRYHHLFVQFLREYLMMQSREKYLNLHHRAAEWYRGNGDIIEAIHHALVAEKFDYAANLITNDAWKILTSRGEIMTLVNWVQQFPENILKSHPRLSLYFSRALYLVGEVERSQNYVNFATSILDNILNETPEHQSLRAIAFNYQATLASYRGDIVNGLLWIEKSKTLMNYVDSLDKVRIVNTDAFLCYVIGDIPKARHAYEHALELARHINHDYLMLDAHAYLAQIDLFAGDLKAVKHRCETVLEQYTYRISPLSVLMLPLAIVHYQQNEIVESEIILRDTIELAKRGNIRDLLWIAYVSLADVLSSRAEIEEATACITQARRFAQGFHSPMMTSYIGAVEARIMLKSGQVDNAIEWAEQYQRTENFTYHRDYEDLTLVQILFAQKDYERTLLFVESLIEEANQNGRMSTVISAEILKSLICFELGEIDVALISLDNALNISHPQRIIQPFVNAERGIVNLLRLAANHNVIPEYVAYLLDIIRGDDGVGHPIDALTEREIEVLEHIAKGASNQDIADQLVISLGTVKSHIHHIMNKLNAQNRTEAVSKARSLNILSE